MNLEEVERLPEKIKADFKSKFNNEANNYGCEIDDINVMIFNDQNIKQINDNGETLNNLLNRKKVVINYKYKI